MFDAKKVIKLLEGLSGESALETSQYHNVLDFLDSHKDGLGYSQFNELLLLLGFDKVSPEFFDFLAIGGPNPQTNSTIQDTEHLEEAVTRFQKLALLAFGNLKFAYKQFSRDSDDLAAWLSFIAPINESRYANRRPPVLPLKDIPPADRYFLGYIVEQQLRARLHANPDDEEAKRSLAKRDTIVEDGKRNQVSYLTSDYLDVYVATSMRERHEFLAVAELTKAIFESDEIGRASCRERVFVGV